MSSLPGFKMEDYLAWCFNIGAQNNPEANASLGIAEMLGIAPHNVRPVLTQEQFKPLVDMFEPFREQIENRLSDFDDDAMSWRSYACSAFDFITDAHDKTARKYLATLRK